MNGVRDVGGSGVGVGRVLLDGLDADSDAVTAVAVYCKDGFGGHCGRL